MYNTELYPFALLLHVIKFIKNPAENQLAAKHKNKAARHIQKRVSHAGTGLWHLGKSLCDFIFALALAWFLLLPIRSL